MGRRARSRRAVLRAALGAAAAGLTACALPGSRSAPERRASGLPTPEPTGLSGAITVSYADELGKKPAYVAEAVTALGRAHPLATVRIDRHQMPAGAFYTGLRATLTTGAGPDVFHVGGDKIGELADAGLIAPLDDFLQGWPDWRYYPPSVVSSVTYRGRVWALPYGLDTRFLYLRRDLCEQAGLPAAWLPHTPEEILEAARSIKRERPDVIPYVLYAGPAGDTGTVHHGFLPLLRAYGGTLQDGNGRWIGDSISIRRALAFYARAYLVDRVVPPELLTMPLPWMTMRERFGQGQVGILFEGGWVYGSWLARDRADTEQHIAYLLHPAADDGEPFTIGGPGTCWFINASSAHKELAWAFIAAWNSADIVGRLNAEDPHPVARADAVRVSVYQRQRFLVAATDSLAHAYFPPVDGGYPKVVAAIQAATARVASGELTPEAAAARYADDLRQTLGPDRVVTYI